jgi:hypothetical protein
MDELKQAFIEGFQEESLEEIASDEVIQKLEKSSAVDEQELLRLIRQAKNSDD